MYHVREFEFMLGKSTYAGLKVGNLKSAWTVKKERGTKLASYLRGNLMSFHAF